MSEKLWISFSTDASNEGTRVTLLIALRPLSTFNTYIDIFSPAREGLVKFWYIEDFNFTLDIKRDYNYLQ